MKPGAAILIFVLLFSVTCFGQSSKNKADENLKGINKKFLFCGGSVITAFNFRTYVLGVSPFIGYSLTKWLDAGVSANLIYAHTSRVTYIDPSTGEDYDSNDRLGQLVSGPGAFIKIYPYENFFIQGQFERNFIRQKLKFEDGSPSQKFSYAANSLLAGIGYSNGRNGRRYIFYNISLSLDVLKDQNSPYVKPKANYKVAMLPVFRFGLQVPLFQGHRLEDDF